MADLSPLFTWRSAICESGLKPTVRLVALTLSLHMNERGGSAFPGHRLLADETGLARETVSKALGVLATAGWLDVSRPKRQGRGQRTEYVARTPERVIEAHQERVTESHPSAERVILSGEKGDRGRPEDDSEDVRTSPNGDGIFEAFYEFWTGRPYVQSVELPKSQRGRLNSAVKEARLAGITADAVRARAAIYIRAWSEMERTPQALLANWARFAPEIDRADCEECENRGVVWFSSTGERRPADAVDADEAAHCPACHSEAI